MTKSLENKTLLITGASRGIGLAIGLRAAHDGANVVLLAKTKTPHPRLPGTIYTAAEAIERAGGKALPVVCDVRDEQRITEAVATAVERFGGIDILVNNASALAMTGTLDTPMKRFDLVHQVNVRATFACTQACLPHLLAAPNPHVLTCSPPLHMSPRWFAPHVAYTMSKYGMSMCVLGMAEEFRGRVAFNALWPRTMIATAATRMLGGERMLSTSRKPEVLADAAHLILTSPAHECTGNFFIDEDLLHAHGVTDLEPYSVDPDLPLTEDLFIEP
ncbi:NAD(P)-dependent oxidoreductase [Pseudenhygromyxa sp. WMMC2535]|uniref:SDR family oxidoreductase n=1 Tax=Pseudenhygromyxa sp. WMMC2535 TaxID=2712867 RepID=UPI0015559B73|nr:NAD(P)-dependent oxidoreductase [Pseudenhygromyxa sp. WMMC2535]NVB42593.1 NAD(P)-dependent oxidoreductase [Pseudenhygromyxa sp. WMMC2535]